MAHHEERTKILEMIASGTINAEEGLTLLNALGDPADEEAETTPSPEVPSKEDTPGGRFHKPTAAKPQRIVPDETGETTSSLRREADAGNAAESLDADEIKKWKRWWVLPLWAGTGVTVLSGMLMFWAFITGGFGFWFACTWMPFLMGVILLALAWGSRTAPWLHIRVQQKPGERPQKIAISFPIPVRLTAWGLRTFGRWIPSLDVNTLDEVILALKDVSAEEAPLFIDVDEGEGGERVQVFIG